MKTPQSIDKLRSCLVQSRDEDDDKTIKHRNGRPRGITMVDEKRLRPDSCTDRPFLVAELGKSAACWLSLRQRLQLLRKNTAHYWCLYFLWKPDRDHDNVDQYLREIIRPALTSLGKQKEVYVFIDRVVEEVNFEKASEEAKALVRRVAQDLRNELCGILVGLSNHVNAVPCLEACYETIRFGSRDRKGNDTKSLIGFACLSDDDVKGNREAAVDSDTQIHVLRISGEWEGQSSFLEFAQRIHALWKKLQEEKKDKQDKKERGLSEDTVNVAVVMLLIAYFTFHCRDVWMNPT